MENYWDFQLELLKVLGLESRPITSIQISCEATKPTIVTTTEYIKEDRGFINLLKKYTLEPIKE